MYLEGGSKQAERGLLAISVIFLNMSTRIVSTVLNVVTVI